MQTETKHGWIILDVGYEYNDSTYNIGSAETAGIVGLHVFETKADAEKALRQTAKDIHRGIGSLEIGSFEGFEWESEPAISFVQEHPEWFPLFPNEHNWYTSGYTYAKFFEECDLRSIEWVHLLPEVWQILRVELGGPLSMTIEVPDHEIEAAKEGLAAIHSQLSEGDTDD